MTPDPCFPLRLGFCPACRLVQLADDGPDEADDADAPPPTSSTAMSAHAGRFVDSLVERGLASPGRSILTMASHGGHLWPFLDERGVPATVLEPFAPRRVSLEGRGATAIPADLDPESRATLDELGRFDLIIDNYLLAHLRHPDFALGALGRLLAPGGTAVLEFDHLLPTIAGLQFDAIRHGHFTYLSLTWLTEAAARHGLVVRRAEPQPVYGGALRVFLGRASDGHGSDPSVAEMVAVEKSAGLDDEGTFVAFGDRVQALGRASRAYLDDRRAAGAVVAAYGAPARGSTYLNSFGIGPDRIAFTVDRSPAKQGRFLPGSRIPILAPDALVERRPDDVLILTWDLAAEVRAAWPAVEARGGRFLIGVPELHVLGSSTGLSLG